jgi:LemA protein
MSTGWIVLVVVLVFVAFSAYNRLMALGQCVGHALADIDVQLKQRHDLIPNLIDTVKGYASHERGTLDDVIKARNSAMSAQGPAQVSAAENQLSGALGRLIALSEAHPDLKANANFQQLASDLSDLENKIAASRRAFNNAVQEYNTGIQQMPAALFAGMFGFPKKDFFDLGASRTEVEAAPQVGIAHGLTIDEMPASVPQHPPPKQTLIFISGWTVEIDPAARQLKMLRQVWRKTVMNYCTFDECSAVGTVRYDDEGPNPWGVYLDFRGGREVIPAGPKSEASRLATELSAITGIPRRDAKSWHRSLWGGSNDH